MKLTLIKRRKETNNIITFIFKPEKNLKWKAGQYLIYTIAHKNPDERGKMRFFTISSAPFEKNPAITTRLNKNSSTFKNALIALKIGDEIEAKGPDGDFVIEKPNKQYIFIAKGVGISPFISILRQLNYEGKKINALLININKSNNIAFNKELREINKFQTKLKILHIKNLEGTKEIIIKNLKTNIGKYEFYVSGASTMTLEMEKFLDKLGVKKDKQKLDYFSGYKEN